MKDGELAELRTACRRFGHNYQYLRSRSMDDNNLYWHVVPTTHIMMHLPHQCALINARFTQNYVAESMVGRICNIWKGSISGPFDRLVQLVVLAKYLVLLQLRDAR